MFNKKKQPPIKSLISEGSQIEGNVSFSNGLRVDGLVIGDIFSKEDGSSMLVVSDAGVVQGTITADHVIINGIVKGNVNARLMLELHPKARIEGDVHYSALEMHQGALITGQLRPVVEDEDKGASTLATDE